MHQHPRQPGTKFNSISRDNKGGAWDAPYAVPIENSLE